MFTKSVSKMRVMLYLFIHLYAVNPSICVKTEKSKRCDKVDISISQWLFHEGFHRVLRYSIGFHVHVDLEERLYHGDCEMVLEQEFPPGVYPNPDEIAALKRAGQLYPSLPAPVNIELRAEEATSTILYLMDGVHRAQQNIWLPLHARYHAATPGGGYKENVILPPKLYLDCQSGDMNPCGPVLPHSSKLCNPKANVECSWKNMTLTTLTDPLVWKVPAGNLKHLPAVRAATSALLVLGAISILGALYTSRKTRAL